MVSWHAIGGLYHVSQLHLCLHHLDLIPVVQRNALHWEQVDPPWELPIYVSKLVQTLQDTEAWIASGGVVKQVVVAAPPTLP